MRGRARQLGVAAADVVAGADVDHRRGAAGGSARIGDLGLRTGETEEHRVEGGDAATAGR
nr:MAG: hypothetical protein DIU78_14490 [Pseudomonadota bacterium]